MRCAAIMQPTFLPWSGYFNLIYRADEFVFYDDVQFSRQSWQSRNRILLNGKAHWLSLSIQKERLNTPINEVRLVSGSSWRRKICLTLEQTYSKHPFPGAIAPVVEALCNEEFCMLAELNTRIISKYAELLGVTTRFHRSSELEVVGGRSERLLSICKALSCDSYISPEGARDYLDEDSAFKGSDVRLGFQDYRPIAYPQYGASEFVSHLSIVDVLANIGVDAARNYVETGKIESSTGSD